MDSMAESIRKWCAQLQVSEEVIHLIWDGLWNDPLGLDQEDIVTLLACCCGLLELEASAFRCGLGLSPSKSPKTAASKLHTPKVSLPYTDKEGGIFMPRAREDVAVYQDEPGACP